MRARVLSIVVGGPLVLAAVLWPGGGWLFAGWPFAVFLLGLVLLGLKEFYDGCRAAGYHPRDFFGYAAGLLFLFAATPITADGDLRVTRFGLTLLVMASLSAEALRPDRAPLKALPVTWLGALYVGWLFPFALRLRLGSAWIMNRLPDWHAREWVALIEPGAWLLLFTMLVTASVDTGAYLVGKSIGKHKMAPIVSPKKTWEGSIGGFVAGLLVAWGIAVLLGMPLTFALTAAALIGVVSQLGDLSKSAIKREIGIKDFGTLIPGHGGVLDRFDSLLFTAPTVYWLLDFWNP